jgi:hypothetical protein
MPWDELMASQDPRVATLMSALVRELGGNFWLLAGALIVAVSVTSYRRGEKWAWYALWILPLHAALDMATVAGYGALSMASATWDIALS